MLMRPAVRRARRSDPPMTAALLLAAVASGSAGPAPESGRPNVLLIVVDDLRPELGCYGVRTASSPRIDAFAATAVRFGRAYCQVPTCGASRASLFSGLRPTRTRFRNYLTRVERDAPQVVPLHAHLRANGYRTVSLGKVLHHRNDSLAGWTDPPWRPHAPTYATAAALAAERESASAPGNPKRGPAVEAGPVGDDFYADGKLAAEAAGRLADLAAGDAPFFLAVGFLKPHLPFVAPQQYWDRHPAETVAGPANPDVPTDAPPAAIHDSGELRSYAGIPPRGPVSDATARELIRGYRAAVSYADANVGRVLDALDRSGAAGNTVVVVTSDHGWNLGEHTLWCKHSCFETSLRVPLLVRAPGLTPAGGAATDGLAELLDLYPTLCDLAGLPKPDHLAGESLTPRLDDPAAAGKPHAFSRYLAGDTVRTDGFRFTEYTAVRRGGPAVTGRMLYDHRADPGETANVVASPRYAAERATARAALVETAGEVADRVK